MKYTILFIASLMIGTAFYSCKTPKGSSPAGTGTDSLALALADSLKADSIAKKAVVKKTDDTLSFKKPKKLLRDKDLYNATTEVIPLDTAYIIKDTLHLLTKKVNACKADNFNLMWNGMMMKSFPPQTNFRLFLLNDVSCKEMKRFNLAFNISSIQPKHDKDSVPPPGSIIVRVGAWKRAMKYDYGFAPTDSLQNKVVIDSLNKK